MCHLWTSLGLQARGLASRPCLCVKGKTPLLPPGHEPVPGFRDGKPPARSWLPARTSPRSAALCNVHAAQLPCHLQSAERFQREPRTRLRGFSVGKAGEAGLSQTRVARPVRTLADCLCGAAMLTPRFPPLSRAEDDTVRLQRGLPPAPTSTAAGISLYNTEHVCVASLSSLKKFKVPFIQFFNQKANFLLFPLLQIPRFL